MNLPWFIWVLFAVAGGVVLSDLTSAFQTWRLDRKWFKRNREWLKEHEE